MAPSEEYVLGTHDEEIARLGLQHRVWRDAALSVWREAGFGAGQTILDIGCGPGYASLDLAEIVTPTGRVVAIDQSRRFLDVLRGTCECHGLSHIEAHELDLDRSALPEVMADGAWCRWVLSFVQQPRDLLARVHARLRPGGVLTLHEYFDYSTWRAAPPSPELEEFVAAVMKSWRGAGGEPDIALSLPAWLAERGFVVRTVKPIISIAGVCHPIWSWLMAFIESGCRRLVDLQEMSIERAATIRQALTTMEATPGSLMIAPAVMEIVAVRR